MIHHPRRTRVLLSLFFLLHFGAVLAYVGPAVPDSLERLPEPLRTPLAVVGPPLVRAAWPVARPYLDLTGARQHWTLFAPDPAAWAVSVEVVAYYPAGEMDGTGSAEGVDGRDGADGWRADTIRLRGPREVPYPHLVDHRSFRVLYNLGYEGWGAFYRPIFARYLCETLGEDGSGRPAGVSLTSIWEHTRVWWRDPADELPLYRQPLGGYDCGAPAEGAPARADSMDGSTAVEADGGADGGARGGARGGPAPREGSR